MKRPSFIVRLVDQLKSDSHRSFPPKPKPSKKAVFIDFVASLLLLSLAAPVAIVKHWPESAIGRYVAEYARFALVGRSTMETIILLPVPLLLLGIVIIYVRGLLLKRIDKERGGRVGRDD